MFETQNSYEKKFAELLQKLFLKSKLTLIKSKIRAKKNNNNGSKNYKNK